MTPTARVPGPVFEPITGRPLAQIAWTPTHEVDDLVERARVAQTDWARMPGPERAARLHRVADLLEVEAEDLAKLETRNTGKPPVDTVREAHRAAGSFRYYAGWVDRAVGETIDPGAGVLSLVDRRPRGTVLGIVPWNVPLFFAAKKFAPALAFGNACIVKPAPETPLTALRLLELMQQAGLPDGVAQVAVGDGELGAALVEHPGMDLIVFTGSDVTGRRVAAAAGRRGAPTVMELGGKSAQLIFPDADLDAAIEGVLLGAYGATGQMCIAGSRVYVHREVAGAFGQALAARIDSMVVGDPRVDGVHVGPQITRDQQRKSFEMIGRAKAAGARTVAQASLPRDPALAEGFFVPPTLLEAVAPDAEVAQREIFGPVAILDVFDDEPDAVRRANGTPFGLAAGIWTADIGRAHRVARRVRAGTVWINTYRVMSDLVPFGGVGWSGYGRENGEAACATYTKAITTWVASSDVIPAR